MKNLLKQGLYLAVLTGCIACAGQPVSTAPVSFDNVKGKEWRLNSVRMDAGVLVLDRQKLDSEGFTGAFTLNFGDGQVYGRGAPNTYRAPYEQDQSQSLSIGNIAATLMAPLKEPADFKENEYFACLGNAYRWDLVQGSLELYTKTGDGKEATLVFIAH
jgi:heat shock protein HslJ